MALHYPALNKKSSENFHRNHENHYTVTISLGVSLGTRATRSRIKYARDTPSCVALPIRIPRTARVERDVLANDV